MKKLGNYIELCVETGCGNRKVIRKIIAKERGGGGGGEGHGKDKGECFYFSVKY